jgi:hypothetical protein
MAYGTVNADVIGTSVAGSNLGAGNATLMKNRILNGSMVIQQRGNSPFTVPSGGGGSNYCLDRFTSEASASSKFSVTQSSTAPAGFTNSALITSLSAYPVSAGDYFTFEQRVEGFNTADLNWGTANAKTVTFSFWVNSSLTGTFAGFVTNGAYNLTYVFNYTISSANTWTQISVTIAGPTSGTWVGATNGTGLTVGLNLGCGSTFNTTANSWNSGNFYGTSGAVSLVGTNNATFYITGVQLEVGSSATGFEYRQYQQELALCQRYYEIIGQTTSSILFGGYGGSEIDTPFRFAVAKRASPTMTEVGTWSKSNVASSGFTNGGIDGFSYFMTSSSAARTYYYNSNAGAFFTAASEL